MNAPMEQIEVRILERSFKLQVPPAEKPRLLEAVRRVSQKMRDIQDAGRGAMSLDRVAVNAALQLVYEFLGQQNVAGGAVSQTSAEDLQMIREITRAVDDTLGRL